MSGEIDIIGLKISQSDWEATPESVKAVVKVLSERLAYIEEQLQQNSQNSSRPPSSDGFAKPDKSKTQKKKREPKKNPSSGGSSPQTVRLYPIEECIEVHDHVPDRCQHCGEELSGKDEQPYRHQIVEIPPLSAYVIEHKLHKERVCLLWQSDQSSTA